MISIAVEAKAGFQLETLEVQNHAGSVFRIACPPTRELEPIGFERLGEALADMIEDVERLFESETTTIVLEVVEDTIVPFYVDVAVARLLARHLRVGLVVVCGNSTTHDDESTLPEALCASVDRLNPPGVVWHPLRGRSIPGRRGIGFLAC